MVETSSEAEGCCSMPEDDSTTRSRELENRLSPDLLELAGSYVGGQCKYDRMFGDLDQDAWDCYPNEEQEQNVELLEDAVESNEALYYCASW